MRANQNYCETLRSACDGIWQSLIDHPFVVELTGGTLPIEKYQFYVEQNIQYLQHYAATISLGAAKAPDEEELGHFSSDLKNIVDVELPLNRDLLSRILKMGAADRGSAQAIAPANLAYVNFLAATAFRGGALEILTAIMPCAWSYMDIALAHHSRHKEHPVYSEWMAFFSGNEYADRIAMLRGRLEKFAVGLQDQRMPALIDIFKTACRLERAFWDMSYGCVQWPDLQELKA